MRPCKTLAIDLAVAHINDEYVIVRRVIRQGVPHWIVLSTQSIRGPNSFQCGQAAKEALALAHARLERQALRKATGGKVPNVAKHNRQKIVERFLQLAVDKGVASS